MKNLLKILPAFCIALLTVCFIWSPSACKKDKCHSVTCANGGVCNNGACTCPTGTEGANCQALSRATFLGAWTVNEKSNVAQAAQYTATISAGTPGINDIVIGNFLNSFTTTAIKGYIVKDSLYIPGQQVQDKVVSGTGYLITSFGSETDRVIIISSTVTDLTTGITTAVADTLKP